MKKIFILTLTLILYLAVAAQAGKVYTVAVADFDAKNMSGYDSMAISEFFRSGMVNAGLCRIINRGSMETVLAEQKFQMSGCTEQDCVVKMGKLLNAEKIVSGSIVSFNEEYYINAKVIDVETGEIQYSEQIKCKDKTEMPKKAEELAWIVAEKISKKKPMLKEVFEKRKKFAIYSCSITPLISIPKTNNKIRNFVGGNDVNIKMNEVNFSLVNAGAGVKLFPWKNICTDITIMINDVTQNLDASQNVPGDIALSADYKIAFKQQIYMFSVYYLFQPEKLMSYNIGLCEARSTLSLLSSVEKYSSINNAGIRLNINDSYTESIYFINAGIDYKPVDNISVSVSLLYPVTQCKAFNQQYFGYSYAGGYNSQTTFVENKPQAITALKLSVSYHFNF